MSRGINLAFNINDVLSSLRASSSPFDEGTGEFLSIDTGVAKQNLDLANRARENGVGNADSGNFQERYNGCRD